MTFGDKDDRQEFNQVFVNVRCIGLKVYVLTGLKFPEIGDRDELEISHQVFLCNLLVGDILRIEEGRVVYGEWIPGRVLNGDEKMNLRFGDMPGALMVELYSY